MTVQDLLVAITDAVAAGTPWDAQVVVRFGGEVNYAITADYDKQSRRLVVDCDWPDSPKRAMELKKRAQKHERRNKNA